MPDKTYKEGFFQVRTINGMWGVEPIPQTRYRQLQGTVAEVNIPYHTETEIYCAVCMLLEIPHSQIAAVEAIQLQAQMPGIVSMFADHFKE